MQPRVASVLYFAYDTRAIEGGEVSECERFMHNWFERVWNQGDRGAIFELYHVDGIAHGVDEQGESTQAGPEAFAAFAAFHDMMVASFGTRHFTIEDEVVCGPKTAVRWTAVFTHTGEFMGNPPTGRTLRVTGMSFSHLRDGKIQEAWNNWDLPLLIELTAPEAQA
ncbi:MAG: ester cyclase [Pseudomonadota bacterium]